jgi:hypothetical protein
MSYLTLENGIPDFSKAVISLWFRVPRESVVAASTNSIATDVEGFFILQNILSLVTFGRPQTNKNYHGHLHDVANWISEISGPSPWLETYYDEGPPYAVDPSYIGVLCHDSGIFKLIINLQMENYMSIESSGWITTQMNLWTGDDPAAPTDTSLGSGFVGSGLDIGQAIIEDVSYVDNARPEFFTVESAGWLQPDRWHHLLLSFDVGGSLSIGTPFASSSCKLWYAIDDVDYRGAENLLPFRDTGGQWGPDDLDANAILTQNAWRLSGLDPNWQAINYYQNNYVGLPSGFYEGGSIPSNGAGIGLPAIARYVDSIFRCEMAEFQMFTGVTMNTGDETNRRAFVSEDGKPVPPTQKRNPGDPESKSGSIELLGKKPEILLHGSGNWKTGRNTGSTGIDSNGDPIALGQFHPTALIRPYTPDPSL